MKDPLKFRKQYESKIIELTKSADKCGAEFVQNNDYKALIQYRYFVNEIIKLKDFIVDHESKKDKK
jgi:hypothetical protein|tara:strand:+ start:792 stop:989 length:198 start_codon:yes stop_codon:yes gene_type:complete